MAGTRDHYIRALDLRTGRELWIGRSPLGAETTPLTYVSPISGRQFVVVSAGGNLVGKERGDDIVAFAPPKQVEDFAAFFALMTLSELHELSRAGSGGHYVKPRRTRNSLELSVAAARPPAARTPRKAGAGLGSRDGNRDTADTNPQALA